MGPRLSVRGAWLLVLPGTALLLLAAHLLHAGLLPLAALSVGLLGLFAVRRPWAARTVQAVLAVAVVEWVLTAWTLAQIRMRHDEPWLRLLAILGGVAVLTAIAAAVFQHPALRQRFRLAVRTTTG